MTVYTDLTATYTDFPRFWRGYGHGNHGSRRRGLLLGEVAVDAFLGGVPAIELLATIEETPLNHPNGGLPADPHLERSVCNRQGFRVVARVRHGPYLVKLATYTAYMPFHVKRRYSRRT